MAPIALPDCSYMRVQRGIEPPGPVVVGTSRFNGCSFAQIEASGKNRPLIYQRGSPCSPLINQEEHSRRGIEHCRECENTAEWKPSTERIAEENE